MKNELLITGGSGLIGARLTELLLENGIVARHLTRNSHTSYPKSHLWDPTTSTMENSALEGVDTVVHIAGAGVADKRWTPHRKQEIINSRLQSTKLLYEKLKATKQCKTAIAASAVGYYGNSNDATFDEDAPSGSGFLADVVKQWEAEVLKIKELGIRVVILRIGMVLSDRGGALPKLMAPIRYGLGAPLGSGRQYVPWIHIDDLCHIFQWAVQNETIAGIFNAVAPTCPTNKEMTHTLAKALNRPVWLPPVPRWVLRLIVGQMEEMLTEGSRVTSSKIQQTGYHFLYPRLKPALYQLLGRKPVVK